MNKKERKFSEPRILWEWRPVRHQLKVRVIIKYDDIAERCRDNVRFWKCIYYEISHGYDAMNQQIFDIITAKRFVEYIIEQGYYFGWKNVLEDFFHAINKEYYDYTHNH